MIATAPRNYVTLATDAARHFREHFTGCARQWEFAGAIRRKRSIVGDIEHIVLSRWTVPRDSTPEDPFYCTPGPQFDCVQEMLDNLISRGALKLAVREGYCKYGERYTAVDYHGFRHRIYFAQEENWGCLVALRTGDARFVDGLALRLRHRNHVLKHGGLWRIEQAGLVPINCSDEALLFAHAGLHMDEYPPERREGLP